MMKENLRLTFQLIKHLLSLLVAAELNEALQHAHRVVSKRHLKAGRAGLETPVHTTS